jgi:hypothetical protein
MPRLKENEVPSYRLHKQSGQAVVTLHGKDCLLGKFGSASSKAEYRRLTAEWLATKSGPVKPVPEPHIDAVLSHVSRQVKAMVELQLLSGARPGEICLLRGYDLDTTGRLWTYKPATHKNEHHEHDHTIYLGPRAQEVVKPFLKTNTQAYLFSPDDVPMKLSAIMASAKRMVKKYGCKVVAVDHQHLIIGDGSAARDNREEELAQISGALKRLWKSLNVVRAARACACAARGDPNVASATYFVSVAFTISFSSLKLDSPWLSVQMART